MEPFFQVFFCLIIRNKCCATAILINLTAVWMLFLLFSFHTRSTATLSILWWRCHFQFLTHVNILCRCCAISDWLYHIFFCSDHLGHDFYCWRWAIVWTSVEWSSNVQCRWQAWPFWIHGITSNGSNHLIGCTPTVIFSGENCFILVDLVLFAVL